MNNNGIKRYSLSRQVADTLEKKIEEGDYAIGDRIPTEVELMEIFSVSRNTIREAIQSLTSAGVLEVRQGDGTYVRSSNRFHANMNREFAQVSLEHIQEARNCLEITLAHLACRRHNDEDMEKITTALLRRREMQADDKENTMADLAFHMAIAEAGHNKILLDFYSSISSFLEDHIAERKAETSLDWAEIDKMHEELYLAIKNRDETKANICVQNILKI